MMKVGFYDPKTDRMVAVEDWTDSLSEARIASLMMTALFTSGKHKMPSAIWCVWDGAEVCSIFFLDSKVSSEKVLDRIKDLMK